MFANLVKEFRGAATAAAVVALSVLVACATVQAPSTVSPELSGVRVETGADATQVVLLGVGDVKPTAFEEGEPARIVVDLPAGVATTAEGSTPVWDGTLEEVSVEAQAGEDGDLRTQVAIGLAAEAVWEMQTAEEGLVLRVSRMQALEETETDPASDPWAQTDDSVTEMAETTETATMETRSAGVSTKASVLEAVQASGEGESLVLDLQADGQIWDVETFVLESPARLVVDLPGLTHKVTESVVSMDDALVSGVRVGQHDDKVRVVVDGKADIAAFEPKTSTHAMGLWVAVAGAELPASIERMPVLASDESVDMDETSGMDEATQSDVIAEMEAAEQVEAMEAEASVEVAATEETETEAKAGVATEVHGVELDSTETQDRVVIVTDAPADYSLVDVDAKTLMVQLRGAHISPEAAVRSWPSPRFASWSSGWRAQCPASPSTARC
jgi:hypothetical protein